MMQRIAVLFHKPSDSLQDRLIQILIPKKFRKDFLHVSFGIGDDYYSFTRRGLEVLDIKSCVLESMYWFYTDNPDHYSHAAFERCNERVTLESLLLVRLGIKANTCASLVGEIVFGEYLPYPSQVMDKIKEAGDWY